MQSCQRKLETIGKPIVVPGLPELAGRVGHMAAQWEAHAQQEAARLGTSTTDADEADTDVVGDNAQAMGEPATDIKASLGPVAADSGSFAQAAALMPVDTSLQPALDQQQANGNPTVALPAQDPEAGSPETMQQRHGPAVDASADPAADDIAEDAKASQIAAGVTKEVDSTSADAAEHRRSKKKHASDQ